MPITIFRAGETITPGNIVAVTQDSVVKKAVVNDPQVFRAIGVATTSGNAGDAVKVVVDDQVHIFSGLTPGSSLYLSTTPGSYTSSYAAIPSGVATSLNGSANLSPFARAISASGITLQTPAAVVADVSSESIVLENTPTNNVFNFVTEYGLDFIKESGSAIYQPVDPDAFNYIRAVEIADNALLEDGVRQAVDNFVLGCKADGIWSAIKASCILAGARTLNGALVPLVGTAPTNNGPFVAGDYNRKTGLVGNGSSKYLNTNRNNNADPQNNQHMAVWVSAVSTVTTGTSQAYIGARNAATPSGSTSLFASPDLLSSFGNSRFDSLNPAYAKVQNASLYAISRSSASGWDYRLNQATNSVASTSVTPNSDAIHVFTRGGIVDQYSAHRLAFYSIGESLDLTLLDARVTALINAFAAAIP